MPDIAALGVLGLQKALLRRETSAAEAVGDYLSAIDKRDTVLHAYLTLDKERALSKADQLDRDGVFAGLDGIPCALKDNLCTDGVRTTCGSRFLEDYIPPYTATAAARLGGAILLGKLNMDEFGMGSSTEHSAFCPTRNPADPERIPGGSSGGAAAAVAAGLCAFALGSDTGGSIRQPAAMCGCVGLKPTYGRVSRYGLIAFASSLEQVGPLTRSVEDNAYVFQQIAGHDPHDATSLSVPTVNCMDRIRSGVNGLKVGLYTPAGCSPEIRDAVGKAARVLECQGAVLSDVSLPDPDEMLSAYYVISSAEASSNLARFDGIKYGCRAENCSTPEEVFVRSRSEGFGAEVKRRILLGTFVLSTGFRNEYYLRAQQTRQRNTRAFDAMFRDIDLLLSPVSPTTAWMPGEKSDPLLMYQSDIFTVPANLAGFPALSVPFGRDGDGLPIGVQLSAGKLREALLYRAGYILEQEASR